jgi:F0F1-type ATP synthase assembly protein I
MNPYIFLALIVIGMILFYYADNFFSTERTMYELSWFGIGLMFVGLMASYIMCQKALINHNKQCIEQSKTGE